MKITTFLFFLFSIGSYFSIEAQSYEVSLSPVTIDGLGGLQSYAVGTYRGNWLLVGGRLDGLHQRQPFASFSPDGKNQDLIVVNPKDKTVWRASLSSLPTGIQEQLSSTNIQFYQDGEILLCTGGYGYSPSANDHITYPYLTIIDLEKTIESVKKNAVNASTFTQIEHEDFRVTGGGLNKIDGVYYLVGGQKFMGRYNPMGPNNGPGFEQEYTNEIRKFKLNTTNGIEVDFLNSIHDEMHLHRRDYNLAPYFDNGERNLMLYSGVFKNTVDFPWLYPVSISKDSYTPIEDFQQYFNHYHCANLPIYNSEQKTMHTLFFGGIAQFFKENELLVQNNDIPFVNTIADVSRNENGELTESTLSTTMPGYLGAGSVFILDPETQLVDDDIIDGDQIGEEFQSVGYIYGGIRSSLPNIFWINTGQESNASSTIYELSIRKSKSTSSVLATNKKEDLQFYPNPAKNLVRMSIQLDQAEELLVSITDSMGKRIHQQKINKEETKQGKNYFLFDRVDIPYGAFYYTVQIGNKVLTRKVVWTE